MKNNEKKTNEKGSGGFFPIKSISRYLKVVSSGACTVASTVKSTGVSVVSSLVEDVSRDQVYWTGFDEIEFEDNSHCQVLLLGYRSGFEVWDVEGADIVQKLASRRDGPVNFLQVQKMPIASKRSQDAFSDVRPLLACTMDEPTSCGITDLDSSLNPNNGSKELANADFRSKNVQFYSLRTKAFVHILKFMSAIYSIRCSSRVVAVLQAAQVNCFDAATLEREYTILINPLVPTSLGPGGMGYGPLALGSRWLAYSGSPVAISSTCCVSPQHLSPAANRSCTSNGNLVSHYAKESSKQLASGIVTLGDKGYKKLSKYCSEALSRDGSNSSKQAGPSAKTNGTIYGNLSHEKNAGMVIIRDIVSKSIIVQFRAHESPISALCFDPSGILLVTASIHGNNLNIFRVMPSISGTSLRSGGSGTYAHLYKLQRGFTNTVIQDIGFSSDSKYIMISSSRGTTHLFSLAVPGGSESHPSDVSNSNNDMASKPKTSCPWSPIICSPKPTQNHLISDYPPSTLSVIGRIRNGGGRWKGAVNGAAAAATGMVNPLFGVVASTFQNCYLDDSLVMKYYMFVFSPCGFLIQHMLHHSSGSMSETDLSDSNFVANELFENTNKGMVVEPLRKWNICYKHNRKDDGDDMDIYGEHAGGEDPKYLTKGAKKGNSVHPIDCDITSKKSTSEKKPQFYIAEAELCTHSVQVPLWSRQNIHFQLIEDDLFKDNEGTLEWELEIERIPTRKVDVRSKDLRPAVNHLQIPGYRLPRRNVIKSDQGGQTEGQKTTLSITVPLSRSSSSCGSTPCRLERDPIDALVAVQNDCNSQHSSLGSTEIFVNNTDSPGLNTPPKCASNVDITKAESQPECVNSTENPEMEGTHSLDENNDTDNPGLNTPPKCVSNADSTKEKSQLECVNSTEDPAMEEIHSLDENNDTDSSCLNTPSKCASNVDITKMESQSKSVNSTENPEMEGTHSLDENNDTDNPGLNTPPKCVSNIDITKADSQPEYVNSTEHPEVEETHSLDDDNKDTD